MARPLSLFVDSLLDDAVRRAEHERDGDRAWGVNECQSVDVSACADLLARLRARHTMPTPQITLNQLRGRCAEQRLIRRLCQRRYQVQNQLPVGPRPGGSVLDVQPFPGSPRRLPAGLEVKHLQVRDRQGRLRPMAVFTAAARRHAQQVRRHIAQTPPGAGLPSSIRVIYMLGGRMNDAEYAQIRAALQAGAAGGTPAIRVTVTRSGRFPAFR